MARGGVNAMGEGGIIEKVLGVEGEEVENEKALPTTDPIAAAVAIDAARFDPRLAGEAADYLAEQRRLVSIQAEHLHEQREVQLSHLKLRRTGERLRVGLQLFLVAIGTLIGLGVLIGLYDAFTSDSVVVNAFKAPRRSPTEA